MELRRNQTRITREYSWSVAGAEVETREAARELQRDLRRANPMADKAMSKIKQSVTTTKERYVR